jgi:hypothetical protein
MVDVTRDGSLNNARSKNLLFQHNEHRIVSRLHRRFDAVRADRLAFVVDVIVN